jgi:hypothetical protein
MVEMAPPRKFLDWENPPIWGVGGGKKRKLKCYWIDCPNNRVSLVNTCKMGLGRGKAAGLLSAVSKFSFHKLRRVVRRKRKLGE